MKSPSPKDVVVVIAARDASATIGSTLASVAGQTVLPGSVVVVDDASRDSTADEARRWESLLPLEVVQLREHRGISVARNEAIARRSSPMVALLDADDVWLPDHLELMLSTYQQSPGIVTAQGLRWLPGAAVAGTPPREWREVPPPAEQLRALLRGNFVFIGTLFAREDHERAGGFREGLSACEDWDLWIRMVRMGVRVTRSNHPTTLYRLHAGSLSFGYRTVDASVQVLRYALAEAGSEDERRWARRSLRRLGSKAALNRAFHLADDGRALPARAAALHGLIGAPRTTIQAVGMSIAPRRALRAHQRRMSRLERLL